MKYSHYADLAELFDYPGPDFIARGRKLQGFLSENYPEAAAELGLFLDVIPENIISLQELHTRTFEIQSLTTLGIGYVMFGDDYKRGDLLANLNREHLQVENDCRGELSDYLPNVLRLVPLLKDQNDREELVEELLVPALTLIIHEFDPERVMKKDENYKKHFKTLIEVPEGNDKLIFGRAFKALLQVMVKDFQKVPEVLDRLSDAAKSPATSDFLGMLEKEMEVELINPQNSGGDV